MPVPKKAAAPKPPTVRCPYCKKVGVKVIKTEAGVKCDNCQAFLSKDVLERGTLAGRVRAAADEKPTSKKSRKAGWSWRHPEGTFGVLHIENGARTEYWVHRRSEVCYTMTKLEGAQTTERSVVLGRVPYCSCKSFEVGHDGPGTCKHILALQAVLVDGRKI